MLKKIKAIHHNNLHRRGESLWLVPAIRHIVWARKNRTSDCWINLDGAFLGQLFLLGGPFIVNNSFVLIDLFPSIKESINGWRPLI